MSTFLRNKTISKTMPLWKENPFPQFNVASHKRPGITLSFEYTTTLLSGEGGEGRTGTATMFRKMLSKYTIFSTVLYKIVATVYKNEVTQLTKGQESERKTKGNQSRSTRQKKKQSGKQQGASTNACFLRWAKVWREEKQICVCDRAKMFCQNDFCIPTHGENPHKCCSDG